MGAGCPLQPLLFFKDKLPAHKKPILNRTSSPTNLSAAVPEASTQERDCHTKTLQELSPNGFRVNSNNLRFCLTPTPTSGSGLGLTLVNSNPNPGLGLDEPTRNLQPQVPGKGSNWLQLFVKIVVTLFNPNPQPWGFQLSQESSTVEAPKIRKLLGSEGGEVQEPQQVDVELEPREAVLHIRMTI